VQICRYEAQLKSALRLQILVMVQATVVECACMVELKATRSREPNQSFQCGIGVKHLGSLLRGRHGHSLKVLEFGIFLDWFAVSVDPLLGHIA